MTNYALDNVALARWALEQVHEMTPDQRAQVAEDFRDNAPKATMTRAQVAEEITSMTIALQRSKAEIMRREGKSELEIAKALYGDKPAKTAATSKPKAGKPKPRIETRDLRYKPNSDYSDCPFPEDTPEYFDWCAARSNGSHRIRY